MGIAHVGTAHAGRLHLCTIILFANRDSVKAQRWGVRTAPACHLEGAEPPRTRLNSICSGARIVSLLSFAKTSYARNQLILPSNGGTVIGHAKRDFIRISASNPASAFRPRTERTGFWRSTTGNIPFVPTDVQSVYTPRAQGDSRHLGSRSSETAGLAAVNLTPFFRG